METELTLNSIWYQRSHKPSLRKIDIPFTCSEPIRYFPLGEWIEEGVYMFHIKPGDLAAMVIERVHCPASYDFNLITVTKPAKSIVTAIETGSELSVLTPYTSSKLLRSIRALVRCKPVMTITLLRST
ncbi:hypothetical protein [Anditalea andensis]|uniref:Uncharacterized protein n=1 Tax=Anditalea andensis TaxID=1048983 RepID=A0A074L3S8_9BACT|nr:hypothetical protein [Anditalea andensis]KEO75854.1 hypothetical protein EL17_22800 [Anditalea andensis]